MGSRSEGGSQDTALTPREPWVYTVQVPSLNRSFPVEVTRARCPGACPLPLVSLPRGIPDAPEGVLLRCRASMRRQIPEATVCVWIGTRPALCQTKREYLRIMRQELLFDICGAPFGTGFFVSRGLIAPTPHILVRLVLLVLCLVALGCGFEHPVLPRGGLLLPHRAHALRSYARLGSGLRWRASGGVSLPPSSSAASARMWPSPEWASSTAASALRLHTGSRIVVPGVRLDSMASNKR